MLFIISILLAAAFAGVCRNSMRKHAPVYYIVAVIVAAVISFLDFSGAPAFVQSWILPLFSQGALSTGIFAVVMYTAVFDEKSRIAKLLIPIRGQLAIIASILTLGHNIGYGKYFFVQLFTEPAALGAQYIAASIMTILLMLMMLPLMVTSFICVRRRMENRIWKKLQRMAYPFFIGIYIHVMILCVPSALKGEDSYIMNVLVYTIVYLTYIAARVWRSGCVVKLKRIVAAAAVILACTLVIPVSAVTVHQQDTSEQTAESGEEQVRPDESHGDDNSGDNRTGSATLNSSDYSAPYKDGTYEGSAFGYKSTITVSVTIKNGEISDVQVLSEAEDAPFMSRAEDGVLSDITDEQTPDVDSVTGATYSSEGIKNAVKAALAEAQA